MKRKPMAILTTAILVGTVVSSATLEQGKPQTGEPKIMVKMDILVAQVVTGADKQVEWKSTVTLNAPEKLTLKWDAVPGPGASAGRWELKLTGSNNVLATGVILSVPKKGTPLQFDVDLKKYLPSQPGSAAKTYTITAWPTKVQLLPGQKKPSYPMAGSKSAPLIIKYVKASGTTVKFQDPPAPRYRIWFEWVKCEVETDDGPGADEPYAVIFVCDMTKLGTVEFLGLARCFIFGPYKNINQGQQSVGSQRIFHQLYNEQREIKMGSDVLIIAALMEHDNENLYGLKNRIEETIKLRLVSLLPSQAPSGRINATRDMQKILDQDDGKDGTSNFEDKDERVGDAKELVITKTDLNKSDLHYKYLTFAGDGGKYKMAFSMKKY